MFVNTEGKPIEPKHFLVEHWYPCLRALGLRQRGLYCCKDTFVTLALATKRQDVVLWVVEQTGVAYQTLREHYAKWMPQQDHGLWAELDPSLAPKPAHLTAVA